MSAEVSNVCSKCSAPLSPDVPGKLCLKCLLGFGLQIAPSEQEEPSYSPPLTSDTFGNYWLLEKIGEGGCGVVYRAEQLAPVKRNVALKVIKLGMDTQAVIARFETERQSLALMDHPNIAKVFDAGASSNGRPFFVMELVAGKRITDYCEARHLSITQRLELFVSVCLAIQHAHQKGIIHRDIKPANILVVEQAGTPCPKVIDFGVARATSSQRLADESIYTAFDQFVGTPAYMSPEQTGLSSDAVDTRTDIYALGVLLYELLTGRLPFELERLRGASLDEICRIIRNEEPPKPSSVMAILAADEMPNLGGPNANTQTKLSGLRRTELDSIILKALEKNPDRRYTTAEALAKDVRRFLAGEHVLAQPASPLYRSRKFIQRNKLALGAGIALLLVLLLGLISTTWLHFRESAARRIAASESESALQAALRAKQTSSASDFRQAVRHIAEGNRSFALAYLNRSLAANPTNRAALTRLITLMAYNTWMLPNVVVGLDDPSESSKKNRQPRPATVPVDDGAPNSNFSPDGGKLAITWGEKIWIRDAHTGALLSCFWTMEGTIASAEFSPDNRWLLTSSLRHGKDGPTNGAIQIWDAATGESLGAPFRNDGNVCNAHFSSDGKYLLETACRATPRIWNLESKVLLTIPPQLGYPAGFSPDASKLLVVSPSLVRVVDLMTMSPLVELRGLSGAFHNAEFSKRGDLILAADENRICVWKSQTGKLLCEIAANAQEVHFNSNDSRITGVILPNRACAWDTITGNAIGVGVKNNGEITGASFHGDGKKVVVATHNSASARLWDIDSGRMVADTLEHLGIIDVVQFSPDGKSVATASRDGITKIWNFFGTPPTSVKITTTQTNENFERVRFHPDSRRLLLASGIDKNGRLLTEFAAVQVWDSEQAVGLTPVMEHPAGFKSAQFSADGKKVLTLSPQIGARVWNANSGLPITDWLKGGDWNDSAIFSPDGRRVATTFCDKVGPGVWGIRAARIWNAESGEPKSEPWTNCYSIDFSPDGQFAVTATTSNVAIRSVNSGKQVRVIASATSTTVSSYFKYEGESKQQPAPELPIFDSVTFSPDGKVVLGTKDTAAQLWEANTGLKLTGFDSTGDKWVKAKFSPDGKMILTVVDNNTMRIWDAASGKPLTDLLIHESQIMAAQFSSDGSMVTTASFDKTARVWDSESLLPITDTFNNSDWVRSVDISPDGRRIAAVSGGECQVWDIAPKGMNFPSWLLRLSEALAGQNISEQGVLTPTSMERALEIKEIRTELENSSATDDWTVWGRWFLADPAKRAVSPFAGNLAGRSARH